MQILFSGPICYFYIMKRPLRCEHPQYGCFCPNTKVFTFLRFTKSVTMVLLDLFVYFPISVTVLLYYLFVYFPISETVFFNMKKHGFDAERSSEHCQHWNVVNFCSSIPSLPRMNWWIGGEHSSTPKSNLKYIHVHVWTNKRHGLGMSIP